MSKSTLKINTGTNLIVRMTITLMNDGWKFVIDGDRVTKAYHEQDNERVYFSNAGELKHWMELKAEDY